MDLSSCVLLLSDLWTLERFEQRHRPDDRDGDGQPVSGGERRAALPGRVPLRGTR